VPLSSLADGVERGWVLVGRSMDRPGEGRGAGAGAALTQVWSETEELPVGQWVSFCVASPFILPVLSHSKSISDVQKQPSEK
jgi:hypothetical protein